MPRDVFLESFEKELVKQIKNFEETLQKVKELRQLEKKIETITSRITISKTSGPGPNFFKIHQENMK